jgi:hypothetical protein
MLFTSIKYNEMAIYLNPENTDLYRDSDNGIVFVSSDPSNLTMFPIRDENHVFGGYPAREFIIPNENLNPLNVVNGYEGASILLMVNEVVNLIPIKKSFDND